MSTSLGGRYLLLSRIARGGMGEVWRARDELLGREVAVKLLHKHDASFVARFRNEARITAGLADPGIAQVYDYGEQDDLAFLVMELVHGESLSAILARNPVLGPEVTLDVLHQTARALHTAHAAGVIHRDIKPGNLLVTPEGTIKITDFGIARAMEAAPVTQTGTVLGTAQYVSPEQAQGLPLTPATDLYSLGVVAYECLAGRPPFTGDTQVAIALRHLNEQPPPLGVDVPAPVRELVMRLLSKDPGRRPATAMELADQAAALRETLAGTQHLTELSMLTDPSGFPVRQEPDRPVATVRLGEGPRRGRRRTKVVVATAGCAAVVGLGALAAALVERGGPPSVADPSQTASPSKSVTTKPPTKSIKKTAPPRRSPTVPVTSAKPVPSRSATVSTTPTPERPPTTNKPTPTPTRTPTRTPSSTPTPTPTTSSPTASPDPGDTKPAEGAHAMGRGVDDGDRWPL
ncbi:serine/threonine-protein kinase [Thermoactinospora rubra]|uniref:serine/threonine-protein kinase n=1 Tax=Thermoactinospora rubra TaxID=1088767 RepID=UPI000A11B7D4|nr:serine/threonine-protein kinase [Thermoactinospora rubra]